MVNALIRYVQIHLGCARNRTEHTGQLTVPGFQRLLLFQHCRTILKFRLGQNFPDQRVGAGQISDLIRRNLHHKISERGTEQISRVHTVLNLKSETVAECHLAECRRNAEAVQGIRRLHAACLHILMHPVI